MTSWPLTFSHRFDYSRFNNIQFPLTIYSDIQKQLLVRPQLDTGSTFCVFQRQYADLLDLDEEHATEQRIRTATGSFEAFGHEVTMVVGEFEWQSVVFFAADEAFPINVVGRIGFLDRLRIALVDYEQLFYLGAYDDVDV